MWLDSDGLPETYNSQATVGLIKTILMRGFFFNYTVFHNHYY